MNYEQFHKLLNGIPEGRYTITILAFCFIVCVVLFFLYKVIKIVFSVNYLKPIKKICFVIVRELRFNKNDPPIYKWDAIFFLSPILLILLLVIASAIPSIRSLLIGENSLGWIWVLIMAIGVGGMIIIGVISGKYILNMEEKQKLQKDTEGES